MISTNAFEPISSSDLIKQVKKGDKKALDRLLEIYIPQLNAFFKYIHVHNDCIEDLIQDTFVRMIDKIDSYDESKKFSTWLMTIGRNLYLDQYRRKVKGEEIFSNEIQENNISDPENEAIEKISIEEILKKLNGNERFLIEMRVFQNVPFKEIAEVTGESETALRTRFFRLINRLKEIER